MRSINRYFVLFLGLVALAQPVRAVGETVLITGANRGIGLEFAKQYAARGANVIATHRRDTEPETLKALRAEHDNVQIERLDVVDHNSIDQLAKKLTDMPIDILINNAGITGDFFQPAPQTFGTLDYDEFNRFMWTNALGALKVSEAFAANVKASEGKKIVAISSLAGSFGAGGGGIPGAIWYKTSKAALNMFMLNIAQALRQDGVAVGLLSPGQVRVEKVGDAQIPGMIEPRESIAGMIEVIDGLEVERTGAFIRYNGEAQPF